MRAFLKVPLSIFFCSVLLIAARLHLSEASEVVKAAKPTPNDAREEHGDEDGHEDAHEGHDDSAHDGEEGKHSDEHEHEEEGSSSVGEGKAITAAAEEGTKIKLSEAAEKKLGIKTGTFTAQKGELQIPKSAIVEYRASAAIFRKTSDGWYQLVPVEISIRKGATLIVRSSAFQRSENLVISGIALLRAAQLEASGQGGEGHAH